MFKDDDEAIFLLYKFRSTEMFHYLCSRNEAIAVFKLIMQFQS